MKIGFIKATNEIDVQWFKPLAFGYLKGYLDKNLKTPVSMTLLDTPEELDEFDIVAISSTSQDYAQAIQIARSMKQKNRNTIMVLGGHHITYLPETLTEDFDIGVRGEGEQTFLDLINYFQENGFVLIPEKLKKIPGVIFRENGNLLATEKRPLLDLDALPHPDRKSGGSQYIFTSRGCPFKCSFCSSSAFWEKTRFFSANYVVEEIEQLLQQFPGMKQVPIWDDLFIADKKRLMKIIDLVEAKGINKEVNFSFSVRANLVDDEMCIALKRLNVVGVAFGAESGSDRILKLMNKGAAVQQNQKALDLLQTYGIPVMCSFIVGWPTETEEEVRKTFEFILQNIAAGKLSNSNAVNILMPIPGTVLWDTAVHDGLIDLDHFDWRRLSTFASYKDSKLKSFDEWVAQRRKNNSLYLNESAFPQERLYERMADYYHAIERIEKRGPGKREELTVTGPGNVAERSISEINALKKSLEPIMAYAALIKRITTTETTLSSFTRSAKASQSNGNLMQECIQLFDVLAALIYSFQTSTSTFPGLQRIIKEMTKATAIVEQTLQPIALCNDLTEVNEIISGPLIKALAVWPGFFAKSRNELNREIETFARTLG
jgi:anaerobic magnesium-protoporphyrin IX monomethyl ester cyclase